MAKQKKRELWAIEFRSPDPRLEGIVAYPTQKKAMEAAARFAVQEAKEDLELGWDEEDEAPDLLREIIADADKGKLKDAILGWLSYQQDYDPSQQISIGPSGLVSDKPWDFRY